LLLAEVVVVENRVPEVEEVVGLLLEAVVVVRVLLLEAVVVVRVLLLVEVEVELGLLLKLQEL